MGLPHDFVLQVLRPWYGIPESGLHWYLTYLTHHLEELSMTRSRADPCVMIKRDGNDLDGLVILQVDDSMMVGTQTFSDNEEVSSKKFLSKPRTDFNVTQTSFNVVLYTAPSSDVPSESPQRNCAKDRREAVIKYWMTQKGKILSFQQVENEAEFISQRALAQYVCFNVRPDVCAAVQLLAPGKDPIYNHKMDALNKNIRFLHNTSGQGLNFVNLDLDTTRLVLMTDASFATEAGLKSQLGFLILMVDGENNCNIIHYGSNRCQRVTRSVMAAEVYALVLGFDHAYLVKDLAEELLGKSLDLEVLVDSNTTFNTVAKDGKTTERRLQIDVLAVKESFDKGEIKRMAWIPGKLNGADALTKATLSLLSPLFKNMSTNIFTINAQGWAQSREPENAWCQSPLTRDETSRSETSVMIQ